MCPLTYLRNSGLYIKFHAKHVAYIHEYTSIETVTRIVVSGNAIKLFVLSVFVLVFEI